MRTDDGTERGSRARIAVIGLVFGVFALLMAVRELVALARRRSPHR